MYIAEKMKTHILCSVTSGSPPPENRALCEVMWKNIVEPEWQQMTIWGMRVAYRVPKSTNTHSEYVIFTAVSR